jgi:hypothetical protein
MIIRTRGSNMKCICQFETDYLRTLRSHFATNHPGVDFLDRLSSLIEPNWSDTGRGLRRQYLLRRANFKCSKCGFDKRRPCGTTILEIDHIDGNHQNNSITNLQVLCPNCHALTPKYRNWHNKGNKKNTEVLRPGNKDYDKRKEIRVEKTQRASKPKQQKVDEAMLKLKEMKTQFEEDFKKEVLRLHESGEIDFSKYGWVQLLADSLDEIPQVVSKRIKRLLPDFYAKHCYTRKYNFYRKKTQIT